MSVTTSKFIHSFLDELMVHDEAIEIWPLISSKLLEAYGEDTYNSWLRNLQFISSDNGQVTLSAPTRFICDWVLTHYIDNILMIWKKEDSNVMSIDIIVQESNQKDTSFNEDVEIISNENTQEQDSNNATDLGSPLDPRFTFDNFVVGKPNELAFAAAKRVAESNTPIMGSNPLFLYGGVGLGKTHLMHAIAWHIHHSSINRKVVYLSAEKFMYHYITALRNKDIMEFKETLRSVDVLMVDDVQFISGKDSTQEEFFHTFNSLIDQKKQLIISADRSPSNLDGVEERIKSRLGWGLVADINDTTFELRMGILQSKTEQMAVNLPTNTLEFIAKNVRSNVRELEGALNKVIAHASLVGRDIGIDVVRDVLSDLLRSSNNKTTIESIQKVVAEYYNVKLADMHSGRRIRNIARPRQIAMYLCKILTQKSLPDIGKKFGRDHSTVIHANKRIEELLITDAQIAEDVNILIRRLR